MTVKLSSYISILFLLTLCACWSDQRVDLVIEYAKTYQGVRYKYGGESRSGIDCSALMQKSFATQGIDLPRRAVWQSNLGTYVPMTYLDKGDLVFFKKPNQKEISHVGLVISGTGTKSKFIHASGKLGRVAISRISDSEWASIFVMGKDLGYN